MATDCGRLGRTRLRGAVRATLLATVLSSASILLATGCGSGSTPGPTSIATSSSSATEDAPDPTASTSVASRPPLTVRQAEVAYIESLRANVPNLVDEADQPLVVTGRMVCSVLDDGGSIADAIDAAGTDVPAGPLALTGFSSEPVGVNAAGIVITAVQELCPNHQDELPS